MPPWRSAGLPSAATTEVGVGVGVGFGDGDAVGCFVEIGLAVADALGVDMALDVDV